MTSNSPVEFQQTGPATLKARGRILLPVHYILSQNVL